AQCRFKRLFILLEEIGEMQPSREIKHREERVAVVGLHINVLIKSFGRKREPRVGLSTQRPYPIQDELVSVGKAGIFQLADKRQARRVFAQELRQVLGADYCRPGLRRGAIGRIEEVAALQPAPAGLPRVRDASAHRLPPEGDVRMELLINLAATPRIIEL